MDTSLGSEWLGRTVDVVIDRPLGSVHPRHGDIRYPVNYGYVPGTMAPDGEPLDAYVLGPDVPLERVEGEVVAIVRRRDDIEDKLVVAAGHGTWSQAAIAEVVRFQERHFDTVIEMVP